MRLALIASVVLLLSTGCDRLPWPPDADPESDRSEVTLGVEGAEARLVDGDSYVLVDAIVQNPADGTPIAVGSLQFWLETDIGLLHPAFVGGLPFEVVRCPESALLSEGSTSRCTITFQPPQGEAPVALRFLLSDDEDGEFLRAPFSVEPAEEESVCDASAFAACDTEEEQQEQRMCRMENDCPAPQEQAVDCCAEAGRDVMAVLADCSPDRGVCGCIVDACPGCEELMVGFQECANACSLAVCH